MMGGLLARATRDRAQAQIEHVTAVPARAAAGPVARVYAQLERDFGMLAPPVSLHSPAPEPLAACWMMLRETLVATGSVDRAAKEAVAAGVSLGNACPYCADVHSMVLSGLAGGRDATALGGDRIDAIADPRLRAVAGWARRSGTRAGAVGEAPFPAGQAAEFIGVAVTFQYLNRMVNVFLGDSPLPPAVPAAMRPGVRRVMGRLLRPTARADHAPGASLDLLPAAEPPEDLAWAAGDPVIGDAFARAAAAVESAGRRSVPEGVRALVRARVAEWDGEPPGLGRAWVDDALAALPAGERPAGRLALLTALASYRVDRTVIGEFRRDRPDDRTLIDLTSWASLVAARRVGSWIPDEAAQGERTER